MVASGILQRTRYFYLFIYLFYFRLHRQAFELCESLNAVGVVLDLHKLLDNRKALPDPESKMAVLEALGEISRTTGAFLFFYFSRVVRLLFFYSITHVHTCI